MLLNHVRKEKFNQVSNETITWYGGLQAIQSKPSDREFCCIYAHATLIGAADKILGLTAIYGGIGLWYPSAVTMRPMYDVVDEIILDPTAFNDLTALTEFIEHILKNEHNKETSWLVPTDQLDYMEKELTGHGLLFDVVDLGQANEQGSTN